MKILGIESSADETSAAVVKDGHILLSNVVASSMDLHVAYGGIVPEISARSHLEAINPVIDQALTDASSSWDDIDGIAVTYGPGLGGCLLVGVMTARTLAIVKKKPLYPVNHVAAHPLVTHLTSTQLSGYALPEASPTYPLLALIVSGGHSQLVLYKSALVYEIIGKTQDDAVGEAFDKVAKILGLPYPGGPSVSKAALKGDPLVYKLPKSHMSNKYDFSFSGLKTAVLRSLQAECGKTHDFPSNQLAELLSSSQVANMAASFQNTAIETLVDKTLLAINEYEPVSLVVAGGVASNSALREDLLNRSPLSPIFPDPKLCTDNGAMIATAGSLMKQAEVKPIDPYVLEIAPDLKM